MSEDARYKLSDDGMTLVVKRRAPGGIQIATLHRQPEAGPFTDADVAAALARIPSSEGGLPGQRNRTRRYETRFGTLWAHLMTGPPTWWLPKLPWKRNGAIMTGWFRVAVAVWFELPKPAAPVLREAQEVKEPR